MLLFGEEAEVDVKGVEVVTAVTTVSPTLAPKPPPRPPKFDAGTDGVVDDDDDEEAEVT